jgi:hypothetical protein
MIVPYDAEWPILFARLGRAVRVASVVELPIADASFGFATA